MQTKISSRNGRITRATQSVIDTLESRLLYTVTMAVDHYTWGKEDGTNEVHTETILNIRSDEANDNVTVESGIAPSWNGDMMYETDVAVGSVEQSYSDKFTQIRIDMGEGDDKVTFTGTGLFVFHPYVEHLRRRRERHHQVLLRPAQLRADGGGRR
jgi:hypothetical protein